jgi:hypothetical protein
MSPVTAIVLGSEKWDQTALVCKALTQNTIEYTVCGDQISALAAILACKTAVLVIGPVYFCQSSHGFLNAVVPAGKNVQQICLIMYSATASGASTDMMPQMHVIRSIGEFTDILQNFKVISTAPAAAKSDFFEKRMASLADKFFLTKTEQDALLED